MADKVSRDNKDAADEVLRGGSWLVFRPSTRPLTMEDVRQAAQDFEAGNMTSAARSVLGRLTAGGICQCPECVAERGTASSPPAAAAPAAPVAMPPTSLDEALEMLAEAATGRCADGSLAYSPTELLDGTRRRHVRSAMTAILAAHDRETGTRYTGTLDTTETGQHPPRAPDGPGDAPETADGQSLAAECQALRKALAEATGEASEATERATRYARQADNANERAARWGRESAGWRETARRALGAESKLTEQLIEVRKAVGAGILENTVLAVRRVVDEKNAATIADATAFRDIRNAIGAFGGEGIVDGVKRFVANAEATYARAVTERDAARNAESGLRTAIEDMRRRLAGVS